ncbi:MAG: PIN domain-containing protein [Thalassospira sp.]|uniref:PIN domain-containing protein n=1 Tax=Thalassospira sp. TaxID=1912094 RepID=UPI0032ECB78B
MTLPRVEHLYVADTNLFFECKKLEDLPWQELDGDPIVILITKPVQAEIDKHKKASGRTKKRALETFSRLRQMLENNTMETVISQSNPKVILRVTPTSVPDPELSTVLDYHTNDDKIVGIVSTLSKAQSSPVTLLTDDTGPAMTAQSQHLDAKLIDSAWKRPPEQTTEQKTIKKLNQDLDLYRNQEPKIVIRNITQGSKEHVFHLLIPKPLPEESVRELINKLIENHPIREDFTTPKEQVLFNRKTSYSKPSDDAINHYQSVAYPNWIESCRAILTSLHNEAYLQPKSQILSVTFGIENSGTRPASNVSVNFEAQGNIILLRTNASSEHEDGADNPEYHSTIPELPQPPAPPSFPSKTEILGNKKSSSLIALGEALQNADPFKSARTSIFDAIRSPDIGDILRERDLSMETYHSALLNVAPPKHDPESFYYSDWPVGTLQKTGRLTCSLFRHQAITEIFEVQVQFTEFGNNTSGSILCTVHAENLTKPSTFRIPVKLAVQEKDLRQTAEEMVFKCR